MKKIKNMSTESLTKLFTYVALITLAISIIIPIGWVFFASLKTNAEFYASPWALPKSFHWQNFVDAFEKAKMGEYLITSVFVTAVALLILLVVALPAAYVIARFEFRGKKAVNCVLFWKKDAEDTPAEKEKTLYVLEFDGDVHAEEVKNLREEVSALLHIAEKGDEVLLKLTSPGGAVNSYGLAASQLVRIREKGIPLTVAVDEVAASGGYLMACVANKIVAAPFAIVGSIGVVAEMPNFHKVLEKYNIDYEQFTAGEYKRTVSMFGENRDG